MVRALVALALTAYILWRADPATVGAAAARANLAWVLLASLLVIADRALMAYRWVLLVRVFEPAQRLPLGTILRTFFVSSFVGTFLPASIGGDAVRTYSLMRANASGAGAAASVLMDRLLGVVSLLLTAVGGLTFAADLRRDPAILSALAVVALACAVATATVYSEGSAALIGRVLERMPVAALRRIGAKLLVAVRSYATTHGTLANVLAGSVGVQLLRVLQAYALGRSLGLHVPLAAYLAFVPVILLVMLLPITIYGLGTSQVAFAALFARVGVSTGDAVALSLLFIALGVLGNLPGAFIYVTKREAVPGGAG